MPFLMKEAAQHLMQKVKQYAGQSDIEMVQEAYLFAKEAHKNQVRKTGEPFIVHPLSTALTISDMKMDAPVVSAAILHDIPDASPSSFQLMKKKFGSEVFHLVLGVKRLEKIQYRGNKKFAENIRKMIFSFAGDIRVVLIKMAERIDEMKTLPFLPEKERIQMAQEAMEIYAVIARRLGIDHIQGRLENLAFPYLYPQEYQWFQRNILPIYQERMEHINKIKISIEKLLHRSRINFTKIYGRKKHYFSLYQKLLRPQYNRDITKIHDLVAIRIIVPTIPDCYKVLGAIHSTWKPVPGRVKDYIALPKSNNYQSIHTSVVTKEGRVIELQIRTEEMEEQAKYGIAAHWNYKEQKIPLFTKIPGFHPKGYHPPKKFQWIQELSEIQKEFIQNNQYLKTVKIPSLENRIFVFTPKGDVIDLPEGATPIDFAYHIHTEVGHKCEAAKVNNKIVKLHTKLQNGDIVEILTNKNRLGPSIDWLKFVKTGSAREKIKNFYAKLKQLSLKNTTS